MGHRITISIERGEDPFHVFLWLRENIRYPSWYLNTTWIETGNSRHKRIWERVELPTSSAVDVYTDPETRNRIMTFDFQNDDDLAIVRLRFNEVPLEQNVNLFDQMLARNKIDAMLNLTNYND